MNAIIALCNFCEVHGPSVIFCTQITHDTADIPVNPKEDVACKSCLSLGPYVAMLSKDDKETNYISTQNAIIEENATLLKHACVRSLSCEVSPDKDGGLIYFGDSTNGHVLSFTFQLADAYSRGFRRWFSLIVLMKDRMFLLNLSPFLSEHLKTISKDLQEKAKAVFDEEKSQTAPKPQTSRSAALQMKSLPEMTNKPHIFAHLHAYFTWLIKTGGSYYEEVPLRIIPEPKSFADIEGEFTIVNLKPPDQKSNENIPPIKMGLRDVKNILSTNAFNSLIYCVLTGRQIIIRGTSETALPILNSLRVLFPSAHRPPKVTLSDIYLSPKLSPLLGIGIQVAAPQPCNSIFRIDVVDNNYLVKWTGELPEKYPDLHMKINTAVENPRLSDKALLRQIIALVEDYQNTAMAIKAGLLVNSAEELKPLYNVLGIQTTDKPVIDFWVERYVIEK